MITEELKKMLHESIDAAKGFGACRYVADGQPQCVVAQFASRCGVMPEDMLNKWGGTGFGFLTDEELMNNEALLENNSTLSELQYHWDNHITDEVGNYITTNEETARRNMHAYVNSL